LCPPVREKRAGIRFRAITIEAGKTMVRIAAGDNAKLVGAIANQLWHSDATFGARPPRKEQPGRQRSPAVASPRAVG
jgi:hypothetical protein